MVYCGKPSRGCQCCKTRRIKCDESRPSCGQCKKSGRECPGYRDEFDLIFRNETAATKKRAEKTLNRQRTNTSRSTSSTQSPDSASPKSPSRSPTVTGGDFADPVLFESIEEDIELIFDDSLQSASSSSISLFTRAAADPKFPLFDVPDFSASPSSSSVPLGIQYSVEAAATQFFFRNFIDIPQQNGSCRGFLDHVIPMYSKTSADSPLSLATHAVALTALGNYPGNARLKNESRRAYAEALMKVNQAIQNPATATSDEVLLSILLFSLYEVCKAGPNDKGPLEMLAKEDHESSAWSNHVEGAVALAKMRGANGWNTPTSIDLFRAIRMCMLTNAIQRAKPIDAFPGPKGWLFDDQYEQNEAHCLAVISLRLPNMRRHAIDVLKQPVGPDKDQNILNIIQMAKEVDSQLEQWYIALPPAWGHQTVRMQVEEPVDVTTAPQWQGPVHVYDDLFIANIVNDYRVSRIFCQKVILSVSAHLSNPDPTIVSVHELQQNAVYIAQCMANDICSSAPYHLEIDLQDRARNSGQEVHAAEATGGYFLCWPLYVLLTVECIPSRQREWINGRLYHIAHQFGLGPEEMMQMAQKQVLTSSPSFP